jgi:MOSC domain-containing protein YiiM
MDMTGARILSVNIGQVRPIQIGGTRDHSAIDKRPAVGPVPVGWLGLAGDDHADKASHGGDDQALYAYAREDLDWWTERLGRELRNGEFGENLTTAGLDVNAALIGETWQVGSVVVQVTGPRIPCATFAAWSGEEHWVKRFAASRRPGAYLRVLTEGEIGAGAEVTVLDRPAQRVTVAQAMLAYYGDASLMRAMLEVPGRGRKWDAISERVLGAELGQARDQVA